MTANRWRADALGLGGRVAFAVSIFVSCVFVIRRHPSAARDSSLVTQENYVTIDSRPHIILYTLDDAGWNDIGYHSTDIPGATPYLSELASKGVKLTQYHTQPSCTPSRATIMSGQFTYKIGYQNMEIHYDYPVGMPLSVKLMPEFMSDLGYRTHGFGKWNIGHCNELYLPHRRGFNHFLGYMCPGHGYYDHVCTTSEAYLLDMMEMWNENNDAATSTWEQGSKYYGLYDTKVYRNYTTQTIRSHANTYGSSGTPLFMWVAHHGMHATEDSEPEPPSDMLTPENKAYLTDLMGEYYASDGFLFNKMRKVTASVLMTMDNTMRDIVNNLKDTGMMENTLIFVHSDNGGDPSGDGGFPGNNWPLRSMKFSYFNGGVRVPAFIYGPGLIPKKLEGSTYHGLMHNVDLIPTFVGMSGVDAHTMAPLLDGKDLMPSILNSQPSPRSMVVFDLPRSKNFTVGNQNNNGSVAIRLDDFKLIINGFEDNWFLPEEHFNTTVFWGEICEYDWYNHYENDDDTTNKTCTWTNFLFDEKEDPEETRNLWGNPDYDDIRKSIIAHAYTLLHEERTEYGRIMYEFYEKYIDNATNAVNHAKMQYGDYLVPWGCEVIP